MKEEIIAQRPEEERLLSAATIRLRTRSPFFAALTFFARMIFRDDIPTAATDGRDVFWNRTFLRSLRVNEVCGVLLHEVLHAALLHVVRRGTRDPILWNIAADIVVNGMIFAEAERLDDEDALILPKGAIREPELEKFSVEEVYELVQKNPRIRHLAEAWRDLLEGFGGVEGQRASLEAHWRAAHAQANTLYRTLNKGNLPAGWLREFSASETAQVDWRSRLWRFMVRTPIDFVGWDRRFIGRGLYLEALEGESLRVYVGIDTSGSIDTKELDMFLGEVQGILRSYPNITCYLFYVDAAAYGPFPLEADIDLTEFPKPIGGGGTDFSPFFDAVVKAQRETGDGYSFGGGGDTLCVYLTDGFGTFPEPAPDCSMLWVVSPGGLDLASFPFGEAVRLV